MTSCVAKICCFYTRAWLLQTEDIDDFLAPVDPVPEEPATVSDKEKFRLIMPKLTSIASIIALHPTKRFHEYLLEFEKVENYVRRGDSIFEMGGGSMNLKKDLYTQIWRTGFFKAAVIFPFLV